jgi:hypothetical protein
MHSVYTHLYSMSTQHALISYSIIDTTLHLNSYIMDQVKEVFIKRLNY